MKGRIGEGAAEIAKKLRGVLRHIPWYALVFTLVVASRSATQSTAADHAEGRSDLDYLVDSVRRSVPVAEPGTESQPPTVFRTPIGVSWSTTCRRDVVTFQANSMMSTEP